MTYWAMESSVDGSGERMFVRTKTGVKVVRRHPPNVRHPRSTRWPGPLRGLPHPLRRRRRPRQAARDRHRIPHAHRRGNPLGGDTVSATATLPHPDRLMTREGPPAGSAADVELAVEHLASLMAD